MRLYSFVNFYLSSIQQGVQTGHLSNEMTVKYLLNGAPHITSGAVMTIKEWLKDHKTYIILNGGAAFDIESTFMMLEDISKELNLPYDCFYEDEVSLKGMMTCCGIIVPEKYYAAMDYTKFANITLKDGFEPRSINNRESYFYYVNQERDRLVRGYVEYQPDSPEWALINLIKSCRLAQ
jgi:hypothetical protein